MIISRGSANWSSHDKLLLPGWGVQQHLALQISQVSGKHQHSHQGYWCEEESSEEHYSGQSGYPQRDWTDCHLHLLHHHLQHSQWIFSQLWHWDQVSVICDYTYFLITELWLDPTSSLYTMTCSLASSALQLSSLIIPWSSQRQFSFWPGHQNTSHRDVLAVLNRNTVEM